MSYLTLKANDASIASTFTPNWETIGVDGMKYRTVGATEWIDVTKGTSITIDTTGIELKADVIRTTSIRHFSMSGSISASGDITSLTNGVGGDCILNDNCYNFMFKGCAALTTSPELPATTLAYSCYDTMFSDCTALTTAPELPATTLATYCYGNMFYNCSSLTAAPELPATTLAQSCYMYMFYGCTSLTVAPALPATTLANYCYHSMFKGCTSLIGYITAEPGYTLIHNHPTTSATNWNTNMYTSLNTASTVPANPSSNVNYYFKPATPPMSVEGKILSCIGSYN